MGVLRKRGLKDQVRLVSDYFTPAMYRGVRRGTISSAPTDSAALQGMLSVDQAIRHLDGQAYPRHFGPVIFSVSKQNAREFPSPSLWHPPNSVRPSKSIKINNDFGRSPRVFI